MPALYLLTFLSALGWMLALFSGPPTYASLEVVGGEITWLETVGPNHSGRHLHMELDQPQAGSAYMLHKHWAEVFASLEVGDIITVRVIPDETPGKRSVFELAIDGDVRVSYDETVKLYYVNAAPAAGWMTVILLVCTIMSRGFFKRRAQGTFGGW